MLSSRLKPRITRLRHRYGAAGAGLNGSGSLIPRYPRDPWSDEVLAIIRAQTDGFALQIVLGADKAHSLALRAHQNGMRYSHGRALGFHAAQ